MALCGAIPTNGLSMRNRDPDKNLIKGLRETSWSSEAAEGARQWMYQTCTEFGFFQTSSDESAIFGKTFPVDFFVKQCGDIYGPLYNQTFLQRVIDDTNVEFGGLAIGATNVVYVHGSIDPWHALGIVRTKDKRAPAIYIEGTAHCANMYPPSPRDLPTLVAARNQIHKLISQWLADEDACLSV